VKTLLLWGVGDLLSQHLAYQLSLAGHRLLLAGSDFDKLQELDGALCQCELHRFTALMAPREVSQWVGEQHVGLDGVVLLAPDPEPNPSLLIPSTANLRQMERSVFAPIELLRELLPQLRRGRRPKRGLIILPWNAPTLATSATVELAAHLWRAALPRLSAELNRDGVQLNVLFTAPADSCAALDEAPIDTSASSGTHVSHAERSDAEEAGGAPRTITPCETALFAAEWFGAALAPLTSQFIEHPRRVTGS
jgi:hypothetical protein